MESYERLIYEKISYRSIAHELALSHEHSGKVGRVRRLLERRRDYQLENVDGTKASCEIVLPVIYKNGPIPLLSDLSRDTLEKGIPEHTNHAPHWLVFIDTLVESLGNDQTPDTSFTKRLLLVFSHECANTGCKMIDIDWFLHEIDNTELNADNGVIQSSVAGEDYDRKVLISLPDFFQRINTVFIRHSKIENNDVIG